MGFKDMIARTPHTEIYEMMKKIDERKKFSEDLDWSHAKSKLIRTTTYSDSIMLYTKDESYNSLYSLVCTVSSLTHDLFIDGIPHKGSIAFGLMTLDNEKSIYFGQPLIDAYLLQEELNFYGIISHATAEILIAKYNAEDAIPFLANYLCPLKNGIAKHLTIFPIYAGRVSEQDKKTQETFIEAIKKLRFKTSGYLRKYIDLTEAYIDHINKTEV